MSSDVIDADADVQRASADPPANTPGGTDLAFRGDVEGLRAVAVVLVVLYHSGVSWLPGGLVGVDVFFVISGFLITGLLIREHEKRGRISISGFYARRSRRILPAAMVVVMAVILLAHHYQQFLTYDSDVNDALFTSLFYANIHFADIGTVYNNIGNAPSPFLHFWSLAVEEQFYLVWPTVVLVLGFIFRRWPLRYTVLVAAATATLGSFIWAVHAVNVNPAWSFFSPFARAWELGIGAVAATVVVYGGRLNKWVGLVLAWAGIVAIGLSAHYGAVNTPGPNALLPVLGSVAVIIGGASGIGAGHLLGFHAVRAVGRVSYGWYLLHYPPMILLAGSYYQNGPLPVHERLLICLATLGIAFVMFYVLERPIRRSKYLAARPWVSIALGLTLVSAAFVLASTYHASSF